MKTLKNYFKYFLNKGIILLDFLLKYRTTFLFSLSLVFVFLSFTIVPQRRFIERETKKLEKKINVRQSILEKYAYEALDYPVDKRLKLDNLPDDMVIYKYNADTIQSWVNEFPIGNDEVDVLPLWYRIHYLNNKSLYNNQLAYIGENAQYVNLGSAWYVVKVYKKERSKVIAGLLIKTEYPNSNSLLPNRLNPKFHIKRNLILSPTNFDDGFIIKGKDGDVLFSVIDDIINYSREDTNSLRWMSVLFAFLALYSFYYRKRNFNTLLIYILGVTLLRLFCFELSDIGNADSLLFSPNLYADQGIFSSFGNLILNNFYVFAIIIALYMLRRNFVFSYRIWSKAMRRISFLVWFLIVALLLYYINATFRSLILNSSIVMELYNLEGLSIYSFIAYLSYSLLFVAFLLMMQFMIPLVINIRRNTLLKFRSVLIYIVIISIYTQFTVSYLSIEKEKERCKVWINKMSVERDLGVELKLLSVEKNLAVDPIIRSILAMPEKNAPLLQNRMSELYLQDLSQKYEINLTICRPGEALIDKRGKKLVDCNSYFENSVFQYGVPISDRSNFFFLNNYDGRVSYLGVLRYLTYSGQVSLYISLESRNIKDVIGYPALLFDYKQTDNFNMPAYYSYAKYMDNHLLVYRGRYNYSTVIDKDKISNGFSVKKENRYRHFINKTNDNYVIVVSRPIRSIFPYIVSFSYLMLFYHAIIFLFLSLRKLKRIRKKTLETALPKKSFRRKVTFLLTTTLVSALFCMGFGSVWFSINYYNESNRVNMEEKLQTVQSTLSDFCKYAEQYNDINTPDLFEAMDRISTNAQVDINLYDPHGRLIRSTKSELFEQCLLPSRMNSNVYYQLITKNKRQVINNENIANLKYYALYAPIFNDNGKLIAIINIPYFSRTSDLRGDVSSIIAAIINVYILLIIAAFFAGTMLSNSVSKPLAEISKKMKRIDVSKSTEHINYKNNDELGVLVSAYNKMVDDLEESTARLAQTEREQAWSEMARQIAHEIKNPLTPMRLSIQHLIRLKKQQVTGWENKFEDVANSILEQIEILSNTASEFSSFAKFYYEEKQEVNLYDLINEQKILFDTRDNIKILYDSVSEECMAYVRKGQIIRVVVNLLSNAIQALEEIGHGYIRISITREGYMYNVAFEDTGNGVKEEDINKLFKPNFTTKSGGTGLGLAISKNIIEQSGGKIGYSRSKFGGANFHFSLPYINNNEEI